MNDEICDMNISIEGMGMIFYSQGAVSEIHNGDDFFHKDYETPQQVAAHLSKGDIVGFCTGSGGEYLLKFRYGYPSQDIDKEYPITIRLAINIDGGNLYVDDLFSLLEWNSDYDSKHKLLLDDGIYHITLCTNKPKSGIWGDNQVIYVYLNRLETMPKLMWTGVPFLFTN